MSLEEEYKFMEITIGKKHRRRFIRKSAVVELIEHIDKMFVSTGIRVYGQNEPIWINVGYDVVKKELTE